ncbi:heparin lyase I family protein [Roseixanthobacter pseudopolyaromaticivorans]|uniref:heparin lyase I family protein n=1 Tax=Xanthobacteraceae TaxID=335928 RepID=UPI003728DECB
MEFKPCLRFLNILCVFQVFVLVQSSGACGEHLSNVLRSLSFDEPYVHIESKPPNSFSKGVGPKIEIGPSTSPITTSVDTDTPFHLWLSQEHFGNGNHALGMSIDRESSLTRIGKKSKVELNFVRHDEYATDEFYNHRFILKDGVGLYLGFAFRLGTDYEAPNRWVLHFQVWESSSIARPNVQPPLALVVDPNRSLDKDYIWMMLIKRNDFFANNAPTYDNGQKLLFSDGSEYVKVKRNRWYSIVFFLRPSPDDLSLTEGGLNSRSIMMWINGLEVLNHKGSWGYSSNVLSDPRNYSIKLGIYRAAQNTSQTVYFDSIRWGTSFDAVDPSAR